MAAERTRPPQSYSVWSAAIVGVAALLGYCLYAPTPLSSPGAPHSASSFDARTQHQHQQQPQATMALSIPRQRALAAVVGGFVSDAATMGLHWIYDDEKLAGLVAQKPNSPEFFTPPSCPYYNYESGALSPYGDEVLPLLQDVATRGEFEPIAFGQVSYLAAKTYTGRLNHIFKELVVKGDAGLKYPDLASESKDFQGATKVPVLLARYVDAPTDVLLEKVVQATKVHQIGQEAEEAAVATALLLQQVVQGLTIKDAVATLVSNDKIGATTRAQIQQVIDDVSANKFANAIAAIATYGKPCPLPGVLQGSLFVLLTSDNYVDAVRANMVAGGDNCSRSIIIGAISAAAAAPGTDPVPAEWKQKTTRYDEIRAFAEKLVQKADKPNQVERAQEVTAALRLSVMASVKQTTDEHKLLLRAWLDVVEQQPRSNWESFEAFASRAGNRYVALRDGDDRFPPRNPSTTICFRMRLLTVNFKAIVQITSLNGQEVRSSSNGDGDGDQIGVWFSLTAAQREAMLKQRQAAGGD